MKVTCGKMLLCGWMLLLACGCGATPSGDGAATQGGGKDPNYRAFTGTIIGRKLAVSTLIFSEDVREGRDEFPNQVWVKYDAQTKFLIDGKPATLDQLQLYMVGKIEGHMRGDQMFAETADFSSVLPQNVKPAGR